LNYKKQRLKQTKRKLKRKKEHLAITLFELKNYERIENIARENLRMKPLTTSQVVTVHNRKNIKRP
jgi:cell division protein FtsL